MRFYNDGNGDADGGQEGVGAPVVAGVDTSPVLVPAEHVLDLMALAVEHPVVSDLYFAVGP